MFFCFFFCKDNWCIFILLLLKGKNTGSLGCWRFKVACRDILRAEFAHWSQQSLIYEQAKQHRGSELCYGIQIIQGSQYLRRAERLFV